MVVFVYTSQGAHGIMIIVDHLVKALTMGGYNCCHVKSLEGLSKDSIVIPYGVKEAVEVINQGFRPIAAFMADAISLGYRNKIRFYLRIGHVFNYDFFYSIYGFIRYRRKERLVLRYFKSAIFVSEVDIQYLKKRFPHCKCNLICAQNGTPDIDSLTSHKMSSCFRLGILSPWVTKQTYEETNWFVRYYYARYYKSHPDVQLIIAGKGPLSRRFQGLPGVEVLGEVEDLRDFFANIDVFVSATPKGCGILNRVLDAFKYGVPVMGHVGSFSGFPNSDSICFKFDGYRSFDVVLSFVVDHYDEALGRAKKAADYIEKYNDWDKNYNELIKILDLNVL